jgi:hypothetical protein
MKSAHLFLLGGPLVALVTFVFQLQIACAREAILIRDNARSASARPKSTRDFDWNQIVPTAGKQHHEEGGAVTPDANCARLHCIVQSLDAEVDTDGLWVTSLVTNQMSDRFQVKAVRLGRAAADWSLAETGTVALGQQTVRFEREDLVEQYGVSTDGVRQDFIVTAKPTGFGEVRVLLTVVGAGVETMDYGAQLVLAHSGRKIAYGRLHVTDAMGKELSARIEVPASGPQRQLAVLVNDDNAVYPVRIDPTFSDANWSALGSGLDNTVLALAVSGSTPYAGGFFTHNGAGQRVQDIAQWDGTNWSALASGVEEESGNINAGAVSALAVLGNTLYAGGSFTNAGGVSAINIAQWNGSNWSALSSGLFNNSSYGGSVNALALSSTTLYAGGWFLTAGGVSAKYIAQWNGTSWSALGSGVSDVVDALAVSGSTLYAGGSFLKASGVSAKYIAKWNGSSWSALGSGMNGRVNALAVMGSKLYAAGYFTTAGGVSANYIAQWDGTSWSALGSGMDGNVFALAVSGNTLYAGGSFSMAGGVSANSIAQWDGNSWSALGSGLSFQMMIGGVNALAVTGNTLYAGGGFLTAGTNAADHIAEALLPGAPVLQPSITNASISGTSLLLSGANGASGQTYYVLSSTNLSLPLNQWAPIATNILNTSGNFTILVPNIVSPSTPQRFCILKVP